jgi:hypothetical protein
VKFLGRLHFPAVITAFGLEGRGHRRRTYVRANTGWILNSTPSISSSQCFTG